MTPPLPLEDCAPSPPEDCPRGPGGGGDTDSTRSVTCRWDQGTKRRPRSTKEPTTTVPIGPPFQWRGSAPDPLDGRTRVAPHHKHPTNRGPKDSGPASGARVWSGLPGSDSSFCWRLTGDGWAINFVGRGGSRYSPLARSTPPKKGSIDGPPNSYRD